MSLSLELTATIFYINYIKHFCTEWRNLKNVFRLQPYYEDQKVITCFCHKTTELRSPCLEVVRKRNKFNQEFLCCRTNITSPSYAFHYAAVQYFTFPAVFLSIAFLPTKMKFIG
jgi:hypothetical protein